MVFDEATEGVDPEKTYGAMDKRYLADKVVNFSDLLEKPGYFEGLLHQKNKARPQETSAEEMIRENERNFVEGSSASMEGPFKYMS